MANKYIKNDIKFFDPITLEQTCSYNGCVDKFEIKTEEKNETHYPNNKQRREITYNIQYRQCNECGQTVRLDVDNRQTKTNKTNAITQSAVENEGG